MGFIVVDIESDGPLLGTHSMVCFGAVVLERSLEKTFYGQMKPISPSYEDDALVVSGFSREEHETFPDPKETMEAFAIWIKENNRNGRPILISDNNGFDASWINWYFHTYMGENPFGWSSRRIGDMFSGYMNDPFYNWKQHRKTNHTHHPVDDAKGNAEALIWLSDQGFKLKIK